MSKVAPPMVVIPPAIIPVKPTKLEPELWVELPTVIVPLPVNVPLFVIA